MSQLGSIKAKTVIMVLAALIVLGGFALAFVSNGLVGPSVMAPAASLRAPMLADQLVSPSGSPNAVGSGYSVLTTLVQTATVTMAGTAQQYGSNPVGESSAGTQSLNQSSGGQGGSFMEFSSDVSITSASPQQTAANVVAHAIAVGGYVAYQAIFKDSADIVISVPSSSYLVVLGEVEKMGNLTSLTSNSHNARVQYTDLNATLESLRTEEMSLLRILNQSSTVNSTLAIESQLQSVNQQINYVESQILQTRTLIDYASIDVNISKAPQQAKLVVTLTATPKNGTAPLSVTFNAVVRGGAQPYVINYNFGDGTADTGQILIHTYYQSGDFKVTASVTDQEGNTTSASTTIRVVPAPSQIGVTNFLGNVANLFVNVVEGIVEVAVVILPIAAVGAAVILPLRRKVRPQKEVRQS